MKFRVYNIITDEDVTDKEAWYIDTDGTLLCWTNSNDYAQLRMVSGQYYYKLEMTVYD